MSPDKTSPRVRARTYSVRECRPEGPLGIRCFYPAEDARDLELHGIGHTFSAATEEIRERVDLEEHVGEAVATVLVDLDQSKTVYYIDWHVDDVAGEPVDTTESLVERAREVLRL